MFEEVLLLDRCLLTLDWRSLWSALLSAAAPFLRCVWERDSLLPCGPKEGSELLLLPSTVRAEEPKTGAGTWVWDAWGRGIAKGLFVTGPENKLFAGNGPREASVGLLPVVGASTAACFFFFFFLA